jgi:hypothetical protein
MLIKPAIFVNEIGGSLNPNNIFSETIRVCIEQFVQDGKVGALIGIAINKRKKSIAKCN